MSTFHQASTAVHHIESKGIRPAQSPRPSADLPGGVIHAVRIDDAQTMCGTSMEGLHRWEGLPWGAGLVEQLCHKCKRAVDAA